MPIRETALLWRLADARWAELGAKSPVLAPAITLQRRLVRLLVDASAGLDDVTPLTVSSESIRDKRLRGLPAMRNERVTIPANLKEILPPICRALAEGGAGDSARHIEHALLDKTLDADSLLGVSLARDRKAIRTSSLHMGFSPDLVWLIGELGSCSLANRLQELLTARAPVSADEWNRGYCPFCGSWPAFIETRDRARTLRCSFCAQGWELLSRRCLYCGNAESSFVIAAPQQHLPERCIELCARCGCYTKVLELRAPTLFPLVALEDLATMDLDHAAMEKDYHRPDLPDLDAIEPIRSC